MRLIDHKIEGIPFNTARWSGSVITPNVVIVHDTASSLKTGSAARFLQNNSAKVSVHFVIERDGSVEQQVPTNIRANHAGSSHYHGRRGVNDFSIGIEFVNPGIMAGGKSGFARSWFGAEFALEEFAIQWIETKEHGAGFWMPYTSEQISTGLELLEELFGEIDTLKDIVPHWYVSPGRKIDTNPLFPLEQIKSIVMGREGQTAAGLSHHVCLENGDEFVTVDVPNGILNMRRWPSFNPNVIAEIPDKTTVPLLVSGLFNGRLWHKVLFDGQEGWIVARYASEPAVKE